MILINRKTNNPIHYDDLKLLDLRDLGVVRDRASDFMVYTRPDSAVIAAIAWVIHRYRKGYDRHRFNHVLYDAITDAMSRHNYGLLGSRLTMGGRYTDGNHSIIQYVNQHMKRSSGRSGIFYTLLLGLFLLLAVVILLFIFRIPIGY